MHPPIDVFAICCGGLGTNQTGDIRRALVDVPGVDTYSPGDWNAWEANLVQAVRIRAPQRVALIGHSWGADVCICACVGLASRKIKVDYLGLVDPVSRTWGDMCLPGGDSAPLAYDWFRRDEWFGPRTANIIGATETIIHGTHNSLPHDPAVIAAIVARVRTLTQAEAIV